MLNIIKVGSPDDKILKKKAKRVAKVDDNIRNICFDMAETMINNSGVGLSGNQVGILKRIIIIVDSDEHKIIANDKVPVNYKVMINPEIVEYSTERCDMMEGCLSIPGEEIYMNRPEKIKIKYRGIYGNLNYEFHDGLTSRIIQHEIDHLDGILMNNK
jgi:peptide deformylase